MAAYDLPDPVARSVPGRLMGVVDFGPNLLADRFFVAMYVQHRLSYGLGAAVCIVMIGRIMLRRRNR